MKIWVGLACDVYSNIPVVTTRILGGEDVESENEFPWMVCEIMRYVRLKTKQNLKQEMCLSKYSYIFFDLNDRERPHWDI